MKIILTLIKTYFKEIAIIAIVLYLLNNFKDFFTKSDQEKLNDADKFNVNNSTLTDIQAKTIGENLYKATVSQVGTDEDLIYTQFDKLHNQSDFNKVYNVFGKRQYSETWGNVGDPVTSAKRDLIFILSNELNVSEQQKIKEDYPHLVIF